MRRLWNFAVVSVQVQVGQAPRRALRLAVPGPYRERVAHRRHRFQHPPDQQGEPDPPLQRGLGPRPRHLHRGRVLGHKEVRFHRPPMAVRLLTLSGRQLGRRTPDQQGPRIGGIIDAHHIQDRRMILLKMQGVAPHPDLALLPGPGEVLVRHHFGLGRPGMQNRPVRGRPPALARRAGRRGAAQLTVNAQSARQRVPGRGGGKLLLGRNPRIDREEPGDRAGRQVREHRGHRLFATGPKADPLDQADPHPSDPHDPGGGRHDVGPHRPPGPVPGPFAQQRRARRRSPAGNRRGIHRHHFALVHAQLDRLDRQIRHAPGVGPVEQIIQGELAPPARPDATPT